MDALDTFAQRLYSDWLPTYCAARGYDPASFKAASLCVDPIDARDCMLAIDNGVVSDGGGGKYVAARSSAYEVLFWEGRRSAFPRQISLWLEPVGTLAALARMHIRYSWPKQNLGAQPRGWAFDMAAYESAADAPAVLAEVKKSLPELERLRTDLLALSAGAMPEAVKANSLKKWNALVTSRPRVLWLLGPGEVEHIYLPEYRHGGAILHAASTFALEYAVA